MRGLLVFFVLFTMVCQTNGQFLDLARAEQTLVPGRNSNFKYSRTRFLFNYPFQTGDRSYLFAGLDYSKINFTYQEEIDSFDKNETDDFTLINVKLTYTTSLKNNWRVAIQASPGVSSNFEIGYHRDDWIFSGIFALIKDMKYSEKAKKPYRLMIGAIYSGSSGISFPIPFVRYYRKFHPRWSYNIGAPISNLQFHTSERLRMKFFATLDGFNANLQREQLTLSGKTANRLRFNMIIAGTRFEYKFGDHIESFLNINRSFRTSLELRNGRDTVLSFPTANAMHFRMGVRVKI